MRFRDLLGAAVAAAAIFIHTQGCSSATDAGPGAIRCTPGANVLCRCVDGGKGTKPCKEDGASFGVCTTGGDGACVGGEDTDDPLTGTPVDAPVDTPPVVPQGAPIDSCPGKPTSIGASAIVIEGDTTGAKDKAKGKLGACAVGGGGPDHVYHLQATGTGSLAIKVQGIGPLDPTVYLRSACDDEATQLACGETTGPGGAETLKVDIVTGRDYYLFVDGASGSAGKYKLDLKLTPGPVCGDGKIDTNEACDDSNKVDGDGCSPGCNAINGDRKPTTGGSCPGQPVHMWRGRTVTGTGSTVEDGNTFVSTGSSCLVSTNPLNAAQDHIYAVTAHAAGNLKVTLTPDLAVNMMLVGRRTCTDPTTQAADMCANAGSAGAAEIMTFPVANNETVYVAAEGVQNAKGPYTIKFELP